LLTVLGHAISIDVRNVIDKTRSGLGSMSMLTARRAFNRQKVPHRIELLDGATVLDTAHISAALLA
jgi:hypothetical protein